MKGPSITSSLAEIARGLAIGGKRMRKTPEKTENGQKYGLTALMNTNFLGLTLSLV
jgi:hypothetical protein